MKHANKLLLGAVVASTLALAACGGGGGGGGDGGGGTSGPGATVPDSATVSVDAFLNFILALNPNDETSEPLILKDGFTPPVDDMGDPRPLT